MIICKNCGKVVSYNSYFQKYICNNCGWECKEDDTETDIEEDIKKQLEILKQQQQSLQKIYFRKKHKH